MKRKISRGSFNQLLHEARVQHHWSQKEVADHIGTTTNNVSRWELGQTMPGPYFRTRLCTLFGKSAQELGLVEQTVQPTDASERETTKAAPMSASAVEGLMLWTVPYSRNLHFTGRDEVLEQLDEHLSPVCASTNTRCAALTQLQAIKGLGGIGKTQIAVEYAYRAHEQGRYTHTIWINAANEETIMSSFVTLAELLPDFSAKNEEHQRKLVAAVIRWLEQCRDHWLLILDNADDLTLLQGYFPHQGNGSILLTTRANAVGSLATSIEVENMGLAEGTIFLLHRAQRQHISDEERNEATNVVIALDGFPLALDQAGAYIEETGCSFEEYLQLYQTHRHILLARRGSQATNYPDSVATTWSLSFQKVEQANLAATKLLQLCAFLAPDNIPEELFKEGMAYWPAELQAAVADPLIFNQMIEDLLKFSLVKRLAKDCSLSIHRLVQAVLKDGMESEERSLWAEQVVRTIRRVFPETIDATNWLHCRRYLSQAQACSILIQDYAFTFVEAASLLQCTASYLRDIALYEQAEPLFRRALQIHEHSLEPGSLDMAATLHNLALLYKQQGKYTEAEALFQQALRIREQALGSEHPQVAISLNDLAALYREQGKYTEAEALFQQALRIREQALGSEHPQVADTLHNLAIVNREQGKIIEAEPLYQRALRIRDQVLGSEHVKVATSLNGLAVLCQEQGKIAEAEPLFQRALRIWERALGPKHPMVAYSLNNLAIIYKKQGKYSEAEALFQRALHIREHVLGLDHPQVASILNNLANLYQQQGKNAEAKPLYQRALRIWERALGPEHPNVAHVLTGLANLSQQQGKNAEAESLFQRALHIREQRLGPEHPGTAQTLHDFATFQETRGNLPEAVSLYRRALTIRAQVLGADHPQTTETRERLCAILQAMGKMQGV